MFAVGVWYDERERVVCMESGRLELLCQIAKGIAAQFGSHCEVVVHDLTRHADHTIVAIENGHVSGRKVGDGASAVVLERMEHQEWEARDHLCYLTRTPEGKILKSSTIYIKNARGRVTAILAINFDISAMLLAGEALRDFISVDEPQSAEPEKIININDVLDELIGQSVALVGKPAALMNKEDKIRAIRFLSEQGAFLVTRSGEKVAKYFGISKYTLYSYLDRSAGGQSTQDS